MTNLSPTLREKKRYLVFEVIGNASCTSSIAAVKGNFSSLFGTLEAAKAAIIPIKSSGNKCMVSIGRKYVDRLKATLAMVKSINNSKVILRSVGVSGALNTAASKYVRNANISDHDQNAKRSDI